MHLIQIVLLSAAVLLVAYRVYGALLARLLELDPHAPTPAVTLRDDVDYVPTEPKFLMGQHFSAIAAAGPIVGPILAGVAFGWLPALAWILVGCIFVGGVHDFTALVASIRHQARSIAAVVHDHMSRRSYLIFLAFIYVALIYIIVAFTDIVAGSFVHKRVLDDGTIVTGAGTASASIMYLVLPIAMGLLLRYTRLTVTWATVIFLPLVGLAIVAGQELPVDLAAWFGLDDAAAVKLWDVLLLGYCLVAAVLPMWLLLQPRGHLGGFFLYVAVGGAMAGVVCGGVRWLAGGDSAVGAIAYPALIGWSGVAPLQGQPLVPMLFITIACGACSGFHCLIASGTTSKQLARESDARPIGYGAMLMEGMLAVVSLGCVMILAQDSAIKGKGPDLIYAYGLSQFFGALGVPTALGLSFGLLAFTTFVYDTLDVCTRLGRYIVQELTGLKHQVGAWIGTGVTAALPLIFVMQTSLDGRGKPIPAWKAFWPLFGASNQLLAALSLIGVTVWLWRTRRAMWVWVVTGAPAVWMYAMSIWALSTFIKDAFFPAEVATVSPVVGGAAVVLVLLAVLMLIEAIATFVRTRGGPVSLRPAPTAA